MLVRIKILGSSGYLGSYLAQELGKDPNLTVILDDKRIKKDNIDLLINCSGLVDVALCEENPSESFEANCAYVIKQCDIVKPKYVINMSSYFVYDKDGNVFNTNYAKHKALADKYLLDNYKCLVLVLGKLFGKSPNQQYKFPEICIYEEVVNAETIKHPFTSLKTVLKKVIESIYPERYISCGAFDLFDFFISPEFFAISCKCRVAKIPSLNCFENWGKFKIPINHKNVENISRDINEYFKEMRC